MVGLPKAESSLTQCYIVQHSSETRAALSSVYFDSNGTASRNRTFIESTYAVAPTCASIRSKEHW